jgi:polysaccharide biosynthesis protein PslF
MSTRFGFVSTYPPTLCGLATFTAALRAELSDGAAPVVRLVETPQPRPAREVIGELSADDPGGAERAARLLDGIDVAIVQHEYGVFGGPDGDHVLDLLRALDVPTVVVLHTVLTTPLAHQKAVLEEVVALADAVVTMTATARDRLAAYAVDLRKVSVIPHGAPTARQPRGQSTGTGEPTILTWGLIGPGKGIEWGIEAMAHLRDMKSTARYVIAGQTHPKVLRLEGEAYRERLQARVHELGLDAAVKFDSQYRSADALADLVDSADVVLLPYDSVDQVTSGVLSEAVAALKPVVATRFPHAVELLSGGAGLLVPQQDPDAIAAALCTMLTRSDLTDGMARAANLTAPDVRWPAVAQRYRQVADQVISTRVAA